jgi:hypothetical protein
MRADEFIERRLLDALEVKMRGAEEPTGHYASNIGHPCLYYLWAERAKWDQSTMGDAGRAGLFDLGNEFERICENRLKEAGFEILESQSLVADEELEIRGRIDFRIRLSQTAIQNLEFFGENVPEELSRRRGLLLEAKGLNQNDYAAIETIGDMIESKKPWVRKCRRSLPTMSIEAATQRGLSSSRAKSRRNRRSSCSAWTNTGSYSRMHSRGCGASTPTSGSGTRQHLSRTPPDFALAVIGLISARPWRSSRRSERPSR